MSIMQWLAIVADTVQSVEKWKIPSRWRNRHTIEWQSASSAFPLRFPALLVFTSWPYLEGVLVQDIQGIPRELHTTGARPLHQIRILGA